MPGWGGKNTILTKFLAYRKNMEMGDALVSLVILWELFILPLTSPCEQSKLLLRAYHWRC
jgi:hypothetical protein